MILPAPLPPSRLGCRCSCPGNSSSTGCTVSSWKSDRFAFLRSCVLAISWQLIVPQTLSATSYQTALLPRSNGETSIAPYNIGAVFFAASVVCYLLFRFRPAVCSLPLFFFAAAFLPVGLPYISKALLPAHDALFSVAIWTYAVASAAAFSFFGLNFGEEAGVALGSSLGHRSSWGIHSLVDRFRRLASYGFSPLVRVPPIFRASWSVARLRTFENSLANLT